MKRLLSALLLLVLSGALAACGGSSGAGGSAAKSSAPKPVAGSARPSPTASSTSTSTSTATQAGDSSEAFKSTDEASLCAYLKKLQPDLKTVGKVGAPAQLAMGLANWAGKHPGQKPAGSMAIDATTKKSCPAVRKSLLKDLGTKTFQEALG